MLSVSTYSDILCGGRVRYVQWYECCVVYSYTQIICMHDIWLISTSMWNIYLQLDCTAWSLVIFHLRRLFETSKNHQKVSMFQKQVRKSLFPSLPNVELFVAPYPSPRSHLDNFCPQSKTVLCDACLSIQTFYSWRIRKMHLILLGTVFDSHLVNLVYRKETS